MDIYCNIHHSLASRHCAGTVLLLANRATLVSEVASVVAEFVTRWIQSPSRYDWIFASTIPAAWAGAHQPILSTRSQGHLLYTMFSIKEPKGQLVICHRKECNYNIQAKAGNTNVKYTCLQCGSVCHILKTTSDKTTFLGRQALVKTSYPQPQYRAAWKLPVSKETADIHPPPAETSQSKVSTLRNDVSQPSKKKKTTASTTQQAAVSTGPPPLQPEVPIHPVATGMISRTMSLPLLPTPILSTLLPSPLMGTKLCIPPQSSGNAISRLKSASGMDDTRRSMTAVLPTPQQPEVIKKAKRSTGMDVDVSGSKRQKKA